MTVSSALVFKSRMNTDVQIKFSYGPKKNTHIKNGKVTFEYSNSEMQVVFPNESAPMPCDLLDAVVQFRIMQ